MIVRLSTIDLKKEVFHISMVSAINIALGLPIPWIYGFIKLFPRIQDDSGLKERTLHRGEKLPLKLRWFDF